MNRNIKFSSGEFYHLYNRGVEKRIIFKDKSDRDRFMTLLYLSNGTHRFSIADLKRNKKRISDFFHLDRGARLVNIGAYCLMPNHFHILVQELEENGISKFMKKLSTGYSMYFNMKYSRNGPLFQGRFKAKHANRDEYLKYLFAYIHLNPVKIIDPDWKENSIQDKSAAEKYLNEYLYSSYKDYAGTDRVERSIINPETFPEYFEEPHSFKDFIIDWLKYQEPVS